MIDSNLLLGGKQVEAKSTSTFLQWLDSKVPSIVLYPGFDMHLPGAYLKFKQSANVSNIGTLDMKFQGTYQT
jgi:hypothetical protein